MEFRIPKKGDIYRHFKGNLYEIIIIARDSETLEEKVVYKELNGDAAYVRSLSMFVSYVDKEKYPDVEQEYRLEFVSSEKTEEVIHHEIKCESEEISDSNQSFVMEFLDLHSISEKITFLKKNKENISSDFLEIVAQSLEFTENDDNLMDRYYAILRYLNMLERYERGRLR